MNSCLLSLSFPSLSSLLGVILFSHRMTVKGSSCEEEGGRRALFLPAGPVVGFWTFGRKFCNTCTGEWLFAKGNKVTVCSMNNMNLKSKLKRWLVLMHLVPKFWCSFRHNYTYFGLSRSAVFLVATYDVIWKREITWHVSGPCLNEPLCWSEKCIITYSQNYLQWKRMCDKHVNYFVCGTHEQKKIKFYTLRARKKCSPKKETRGWNNVFNTNIFPINRLIYWQNGGMKYISPLS